MTLPPLRFEPYFQYRLWGGRRLGGWMDAKLPDGPIGEAWILSDRDDVSSAVAEGPLKGRTLTQLMASHHEALMGELAGKFDRFPLLLKFLDVQEMLSVQVHPPASKAELIPKGENPKTEAWIVLEADEGGRIYAGLKPHTTEAELRALHNDTVDEHLASFAPHVGQGVVIHAGDVHALGDGVMVFEVQQNSDVTFRLYDWEHVDKTTGKPRELQVDKAIQCVDFDQGAIQPVKPKPVEDSRAKREDSLSTEYFAVQRVSGEEAFPVGRKGEPRILVCLEGAGQVANEGGAVAMRRGSVVLLAAACAGGAFTPSEPSSVLEIAIPRAAPAMHAA